MPYCQGNPITIIPFGVKNAMCPKAIDRSLRNEVGVTLWYTKATKISSAPSLSSSLPIYLPYAFLKSSLAFIYIVFKKTLIIFITMSMCSEENHKKLSNLIKKCRY